VKKHVLIVDDEPTWVTRLTRELRRRACVVTEVSTSGEAIARVRGGFDGLVLLASDLPDSDTVAVVGQLKGFAPDGEFVLMTRQGMGPEDADQMPSGLRVIPKSDGPQRLATLALEVLDARERETPGERSGSPLHTRHRFASILTRSPRMRRVFEMLTQVVDSRVSVLIEGESGTGKELVARALHHEGRRGDAPFVAVNCAGIPDALLESELFGHERGAFTGAIASRKGKFEQADGGTLFLDEIGEMPPHLQAKLLRVLQDRQIERVGGTALRPVDVRIISATHRDLSAMVEARTFREDLYYRLAVFPISLPPLRAREGDVQLLARHFLARFCAEEHKAPLGLAPETLAILERHPFPGNVRELENVISRAVLVAAHDLVRPDDLPDDFLGRLGDQPSAPASAVSGLSAPSQADAAGPGDPLTEALTALYPSLAELPSLASVEHALFSRALALANGNVGRASMALGVSRATLYRRLRQAQPARTPDDEPA
jgi:DNA-binding NtrC family response regulator